MVRRAKRYLHEKTGMDVEDMPFESVLREIKRLWNKDSRDLEALEFEGVHSFEVAQGEAASQL